MNILQIIGGSLLILASVLLVIVVVMQESKQPGLSAMTGQADSYLSKNKSKTLESKMVALTRVLIIAFFVVAIGMNLIVRYVK